MQNTKGKLCPKGLDVMLITVRRAMGVQNGLNVVRLIVPLFLSCYVRDKTLLNIIKDDRA